MHTVCRTESAQLRPVALATYGSRNRDRFRLMRIYVSKKAKGLCWSLNASSLLRDPTICVTNSTGSGQMVIPFSKRNDWSVGGSFIRGGAKSEFGILQTPNNRFYIINN